MSAPEGASETGARRVRDIREEMRFEIGVLHDRINALVSAEAFLTIAFTMSLAYAGEGWSGRFFPVAPLLAMVGFLLAVLAWPSVARSVDIALEWNLLLIAAVRGARADPDFVWRPSVDAIDDARTQAHHRRGLLFARFVPAIFAVTWVLLGTLVLTGPMRHP